MQHQDKQNQVPQHAFGQTRVFFYQLGQIIQSTGHAQGAEHEDDTIANERDEVRGDEKEGR
jgi:hypothetical protein